MKRFASFLDKVCWEFNLLLDKSHFITVFITAFSFYHYFSCALIDFWESDAII